jgi:hypothetical protein
MPLKQIPQGTEVHISTHPENSVVKTSTESPRQYEVETPTGVIKRNRVQLVPLPEKTIAQRETSESEDNNIPELNIYSRPKRTVKLSLKARESKGLA